MCMCVCVCVCVCETKSVLLQSKMAPFHSRLKQKQTSKPPSRDIFQMELDDWAVINHRVRLRKYLQRHQHQKHAENVQREREREREREEQQKTKTIKNETSASFNIDINISMIDPEQKWLLARYLALATN